VAAAAGPARLHVLLQHQLEGREQLLLQRLHAAGAAAAGRRREAHQRGH